jgi:hypothetical protein
MLSWVDVVALSIILLDLHEILDTIVSSSSHVSGSSKLDVMLEVGCFYTNIDLPILCSTFIKAPNYHACLGLGFSGGIVLLTPFVLIYTPLLILCVFGLVSSLLVIWPAANKQTTLANMPIWDIEVAALTHLSIIEIFVVVWGSLPHSLLP